VTLGITLGKSNKGSGGLVVLRIKDGGVASKDGRLAVGDWILSVDDTSVADMKPMDAQKMLVGPIGSSSTLKISKNGPPASVGGTEVEGLEVTELILRRDVGPAAPAHTQNAAFGIVRKA